MASSIRNILVVEDDGPIRDSIAEVLEGEGFGVCQAANGAEALERLKNVEPDLILLDLMMPVMDGWQFRCEQEHDPRLRHIPVLVISADHALEQKVDDLHVEGWLAKPFALETLLDAIGRVGERRPPSPAAHAAAH